MQLLAECVLESPNNVYMYMVVVFRNRCTAVFAGVRGPIFP